MSEFEWYECYVASKAGDIDFWRRFLATSQEDAVIRNNKVIDKSIFSIKHKLVRKLLVKEYRAQKVSDDILEMYDFSTANGTDEFYNRDNEVMEWLLA